MPQSSHLPDSATPSTTQPSVRAGEVRVLTGQTLDKRYRLERLLGTGGMGSVWLARHVVIGKPVAVKILDSRLVAEAEGEKRLFREAQSAAAIGHPNIIDVLDVGVSPTGDPYLVMEYLEGEDLSTWMRREGVLPVSTACAICEPILAALRAAHAKGIVHRDLKPANIFLVLRDNAVPSIKLIDFGISKVVGSNDLAKITQTGALLGTPAYMSPEQARGEENVDGRADLYAVGVILYQLLTGKLPFRGSNYNDLLYKIINDEPTLPESTVAQLPKDVGALIRRALAKDPAERHQSAEDFLSDLQSLKAWPQRGVELEKLSSSIESTVFGGGDLGSSTQLSPMSPVDVRQMMSEVLPDSELPTTKAESPGAQPPTRPRRWWVPVAVAAGVLLVAQAVFDLRSSSAPAPAASPAAVPALPAGVQITLVGAPDGARILYDGAPVTMNPFRVRPAETIVPIRVEQVGYQPFVTTVVPSRDLEVRVILVPGAMAAAEPSASAAPAPSASAAAPEQRRPRRRSRSSAIGTSGRDTLYSEKFE